MLSSLYFFLLTFAMTQAVYNEDCTGAQIGKQCSFDCTKVIYCDENGNNYTLGICGQDEMCVDGQCISKTVVPSPVCAPKPAGPFTLPFKCSDVGIFPNIMSCDRFYFCAERGQTPSQECVCGDGEVFDYETSRCEKVDPSVTTQCKKTFCVEGVGTCGGLPDNDDTPQYAYVCLEDSGYVVPMIFMSYCSGKYEVDCSCTRSLIQNPTPISQTCGDYGASSTTTTTPASTTTTPAPQSDSTTASTTTTTLKSTPPQTGSSSTLHLHSLSFYLTLILAYLLYDPCFIL